MDYFMIRISCLALFSASLIIGCVAHNPDKELVLMSYAGKYAKCYDSNECELMWNRANEWIDENTTYSINIRTDAVIQTGGPVIAYANPTPSIRIEKVPIAGGGFEITINAICGNKVGCVPDRYKLMISFNTYVSTGKKICPRDL